MAYQIASRQTLLQFIDILNILLDMLLIIAAFCQPVITSNSLYLGLVAYTTCGGTDSVWHQIEIGAV